MLIVVRHGQTEANVNRLISGRTDVDLTDAGRRQIQAVARGLPRPSRVISSPLRRARETAEALGCPVEIDERWIELDYGELEGRKVDSVPPEVWKAWRADLSYAPAGGESTADLARRVRAACDDLADEARRADVVVVTHVSPIKVAVSWALGVDNDVGWRLYVEDGAVCRIGFGPHGPMLHSFNERFPDVPPLPA